MKVGDVLEDGGVVEDLTFMDWYDEATGNTTRDTWAVIRRAGRAYIEKVER